MFPFVSLKRLYIYIWNTYVSLYLHCQILNGTLMFPFVSLKRLYIYMEHLCFPLSPLSDFKWDTYVSLCFFEAVIYIWNTYVSLYLHCQILNGTLMFPFVSLKRLYIYIYGTLMFPFISIVRF